MTVLKRASTILVCFLVGTINGNIHVTQDTRVIEEGSCENEDYCTAEDDALNSEQATYKYSADVQQAREIFKDTVDATREPSEEELKVILHEMEVKWPDEDESDYDIDEHLDVIGEYLQQTQTQQNGERNVIDTEASQETKSDYEFPRLVTVEPGNVGDVQIFKVDNEYVYERITMSVRPPIFEIPDFLTGEECDYIIETAKKNGLDQSNLFGAEIKDELNKNRNNSDISRVSDQTWLRRTVLGEAFWAKLNTRLSALTMLDIGIINRSEPMQVVSYVPGGHYHAHLDTVESSDLPCCFQTHCGEKEETAAWSECCRLCRYITVLYYLNDVEAGGETVFPLADMPDELYNEKMTNLPAHKWYNLSLYCHNSSLIVSPKRGTAIFWYSHFIDEQTGYLGPVDQRSHHGGCDLLKGQKWIANSWISGTTHRDRFKPGVFYTP